MPKIHFEHHKVANRHVTVCLIDDPGKNKICIGIAICSNHDRNLRKLGNKIALGRAEKETTGISCGTKSRLPLNKRIIKFLTHRDFKTNPSHELPPGSKAAFLLG